MNAHLHAPDRSLRGPARVLFWTLPLAALVAALAAAAGPGFGHGWWHYRTSFQLLRWSEWLSYGVIAMAVVGIHLFAYRRRWLQCLLQFVALGLAIAVVVQINQFWGQAASVPPIHDITTDPDDPPPLVALLALRGPDSNSADYAGAEIADQQRQAYPDLAPLRVKDSPASAFSAAGDAATQLGWELVELKPAEGRIEAVATTPWFGFKDDVVIRVRAAPGGSVIDVRSISRVGVSDLGANAQRIREYLTALKRRTQVHD